MIRDLVSDIGGVGLYGLIALLLFFAVFVGVLIWTVRLRRGYLRHMAELPLEDDDATGAPGERRNDGPPKSGEATHD
jgi:hypothetical protein